MKKICVTGGIACGKSSFGDILVRRGVPVVDADEICHELLGRECFARRAAAEFGRRILDRSGAVDRRILGGIIFDDAEKRKKLNALLHPEARRVIKAWFERQQAADRPFAAALVPLVYEAGWERDWDGIVCVASPRALQISRLRKKGFSAGEADARISVQMPLDEKMSRADYVVFNSGNFTGLRRQAGLIIRNLKEQAER